MTCNRCNKKHSKPFNNTVDKVNTILDATSKKLFGNRASLAKAKPRVAICEVCEFAKMFLPYQIISDKQFPSIYGKRCTKCGCSLSLKVRSRDNCPIKKW